MSSSATEKADTRQWSTLPSEILMAEVDLKNGEYIAVIGDKDKKLMKKVGDVVISDQKPELISLIAR